MLQAPMTVALTVKELVAVAANTDAGVTPAARVAAAAIRYSMAWSRGAQTRRCSVARRGIALPLSPAVRPQCRRYATGCPLGIGPMCDADHGRTRLIGP